jgi:hypothetical protein
MNRRKTQRTVPWPCQVKSDKICTAGEKVNNIQDAGLSLFLKGPSGSGKTEGALSLPNPTYLVYTDVNLATVRSAMKRGLAIDFDNCTSWSNYQHKFIPRVHNRQIKAATIVVDTIDFLADMMWREIQGGKPRLSMSDFGTGLSNLMSTTYTLASATLPVKNHPGYNVVVTSHLKDVTDEGGALLKVTPAIMGAFKDKVEDFFDHVYLCEAGVKTEVIENTAVKTRQFKVYTVDPNRFNTCKAPPSMPPEIIIPVGKSLFEVCNDYWGLNPTKPMEQNAPAGV